MHSEDAACLPARYRTELLTAISAVDLVPVRQAIDALLEARTLNRRVYVCSSGAVASLASQFLCDLVKRGANNRSPRFRILALADTLPHGEYERDGLAEERFFLEHLDAIVEDGDLVIGISLSGHPGGLQRAFEYVRWAGCNTIAITGCDGRELGPLADAHILFPAFHPAALEALLIVTCQMIGYSFLLADSG